MNAACDPNSSTDHSTEEAHWVAAARKGNQDAFDRLVERYQRRVVSVAYRLLGNLHDAADVSQDAFLRAYRNLDKLEDVRRFGPWLMRITTNLSLNFRRSRSRAAAMSTDELIEGGEELRTASGAPLAQAGSTRSTPDTQELREAVGKAVDELPEKQRLALVLFSLEGLPQKEVAAIMDCSVELVKWNVFQARKTLRHALAEFLE